MVRHLSASTRMDPRTQDDSIEDAQSVVQSISELRADAFNTQTTRRPTFKVSNRIAELFAFMIGM